jgi:DNA-binding CsgD family transcriptional regulator
MSLHAQLTNTQFKVLELIAEGLTTKQIAGLLNLKPKTVENHRYAIARKLGITGNNCVMKYALAHKSELNIPEINR